MHTISNNSTYLTKRPLDKGGGRVFFSLSRTLALQGKNIINNLWLITHMLGTEKGKKKKYIHLTVGMLFAVLECSRDCGGEANGKKKKMKLCLEKI